MGVGKGLLSLLFELLIQFIDPPSGKTPITKMIRDYT